LTWGQITRSPRCIIPISRPNIPGTVLARTLVWRQSAASADQLPPPPRITSTTWRILINDESGPLLVSVVAAVRVGELLALAASLARRSCASFFAAWTMEPKSAGSLPAPNHRTCGPMNGPQTKRSERVCKEGTVWTQIVSSCSPKSTMGPN
jgi:hypothetical protein